MDSGCSRHVTGDEAQFTSLRPKEGGLVTFGDNSKGKIISIGSVDNNSTTSIKNVLFVKGLKYNLLSISQLCDKGCKVVFESSKCDVTDINSDKTILTGYIQGNIYTFDLNDLSFCNIECLTAMNSDESWLWHRRLGHISMSILLKFFKNDLVKELPKTSLIKIEFVMLVNLENKLEFLSKL